MNKNEIKHFGKYILLMHNHRLRRMNKRFSVATWCREKARDHRESFLDSGGVDLEA